ncbi:NTP transferase domain-containing protein [Stygiolobus sp. RP850M]|uniref:NTP transferase domain-containing protein n=1 Tax=Stygiolobus sp. RP850M TaxID=3133137 RepID=UPI00307ED695
MKAIIMAGGKGTRFTPLKPLVEVCGLPSYYRVYQVARMFAEEVFLAITNSSPLIFSALSKIITEGRGYEMDVYEAVKTVGVPTLVFPADTPIIPIDAVEILISSCEADICSLKNHGDYVGISLWRGFNTSNYQDVEYSSSKIYNVNTYEDYVRVNYLCRIGV